MYLIETERFIWKQKDPEELQIALVSSSNPWTFRKDTFRKDSFQVVTQGRFEKIKEILVKLKLIFEKKMKNCGFYISKLLWQAIYSSFMIRNTWK